MITHWLLLGIVCWTLSFMITKEEGPFGIFDKLRKRLGVTHYETYEELPVVEEEHPIIRMKLYTAMHPSHTQPSILARGVTCLYCTSVWVSIALTLLYAGILWLGGGLYPELLFMPFFLRFFAVVVQEKVVN